MYSAHCPSQQRVAQELGYVGVEWRQPKHSKDTLTRPASCCLTSASLLTNILRALFCEVARPRYNVHIYLQNDTSARVCRCHDSSPEHIQEPNYSTEFPLYTFPHPIAFSPGVAVAVVARILWVGPSCQSNASFLAPNFSPAGAIHQHREESKARWTGRNGHCRLCVFYTEQTGLL